MPTQSLGSPRTDRAVDADSTLKPALTVPQTGNRVLRWRQFCRDFLKCHRRPFNVALHTITTPIGVFGLISMIRLLSPDFAVAMVVAYVVVLLAMVPKAVWLASTAVMVALLTAALILSPGWLAAGSCVAFGYFGQDLAHLITGERTLQSTYIRDQNRVARLVEHGLLLVPTLLVIAGRQHQSPLRLLVSRKAVLHTKLTSPDQVGGLGEIRTWVRMTEPNLSRSTHWWQTDLTGEAREAFDRLSRDASLMAMIRRFHGTGYEVHPVLGMNELYVTGPPKQSTSDTVFYMGHVDGPWSVFPGARLYRCMVAASENAEVTTHFPMIGADYAQPEGYRLETGDSVAFDFNRELHYITRDPSAKQVEPRVNLKLHFVAHPDAMSWYGSLLAKLTTVYDLRARGLFLQTIDPNSWVQNLKTQWILGWTKAFEWIVRFVGWTNLAYVLLMAAISVALGDPRWFVATTSFVHYAIYIATLRERGAVSFGEFRRNALFFKTVALTQLFVLYASFFSGQLLSLGIVVGGFALAARAASVLGMNRTLFSAELGIDPPLRLRRFPYGFLPHPMILGAMSGIAAMLLVPSFRASFGWLCAGHLCCYATVLAQEILRSRQSSDSRAVLSPN
ncbi:MAG: hypothetical protein EA381_15480 [Planctomycetaceae bacterium]|nr:MAG: hypothetical protein EA381_15480 [Planctomycetaceae bacterium]